MKCLELFIGAIILWGAAYLVGVILFEKDSNKNISEFLTIISIFSIILSVLNIADQEIIGGIIKIICVYCLQSLFYKIIFDENISKAMVVSLIWYLCLFVSEIILILIASIIFNDSHDSVFFLKNTIIMNFLISIFDYLIITTCSKKLKVLVKNSKISGKMNFIIVLIILITLSLLVFKIPVKEWRLSVEFVVTMSILLCFCFVGLFLLKQKSDIEKTESMYQQLIEYSDITNSLLEDYRVVSHEHKNQLSIIRGMIDDNKEEIADYVDNLLEKREIIKYQWISELNHLPLSGLKGLINYKLIEMETANININISISNEIKKTKLSKLSNKQRDNLYSIMGVYLDNAIYAARKSKKKEISLEIYKDKKDIVVVLANTYNGKIELNKLDNYGYTTKGKNHGVGLHIVKKIIEENDIFYQDRSLAHEYYIQRLRISLSDLNTKNK